MANPFDQFDTPKAKDGGNPFDQFDTSPSAPAAAPAAPAQPESGLKSTLMEIPRIASEAIAAPVNAIAKAYKGFKGIGATVGSLAGGSDLDTALRAGTEAIGNRNAITSPLAPSKTGQFLGEHVIQPAVKGLSDITGQPELVSGVAEAAGDIASLYGIKPGVSAAKGTIGKALSATELPEKFYASAAKLPLSKAWTRTIGEEMMSKRKAAISAGLEGEVPISEQGIAKAKNLELAHRNAVDSMIAQLNTKDNK